ncbi:MAG TPA: response regulator transcription factor [Bacteroidales bacterium]|nr:response regulator transcription factor [Bacteroidales bacterium]
MHKILVVEDEQAMLLGLRDNLEIEGYEVDTANNGADGLNKILENEYNLIILDVMLPQMSGFDVCRTVRKRGKKVPIILLTAKGEEIDKVFGLEIGADDYITKPFSLRELLARIKAILRRTATIESDVEQGKLPQKIGRLQVNFTSYVATDETGAEVKLSHKEFELLHYFVKNSGQVISRDELIKNVWNYNYEMTTRTIDNFVVKLRQKIEVNPNEPHLILTVHGTGYKMVL